jgi:release factor glutamine methyltransferase
MVYACLEKLLGTTRHTHILEPGYEVADQHLAAIRESFDRMASGEPLQYVLNEAWFYGRRFNVTPDVLIPRPETEILCRTVLERPSLRILDLCTGSGCIAWTLALEIPGAEVVAVDISDGALKVAQTQDFSEEISRTSARQPRFIKADVLGQSLQELGQFDIIVSNPPYVMESEKAMMRPNVLEHEPHLALFVPDDDPLLFYRAVAEWALRCLKPGGFGIVEINEALAFSTEEIFRNLSFSDVHTIKDLNDRDRYVFFRN